MHTKIKLLFQLAVRFLVCTMVWGCTESFAQSVISTEFDSAILMGSGYDPEYGRVGDTCVTAANPVISGPASGSSVAGLKELLYRASVVENSREFEKLLGLSAAANYGTLQGKAAFSESVNINSYNVFVLVEVKVLTQSETISDIEISKKALTTLEGNPEKFRKVCGTEFVVSLIKGGQMFGVIEIHTNSKTEQNELKASISGSGVVFKASAEFAQRLKEIISSKNSNVSLWASGTLGDKLPGNVQEMIQYAAGFPSRVVQNPTSFAASTRSYERVLNFPVIGGFAKDNRAAILVSLSDKRAEYLKTKNDYEFALSHHQQFKVFDKELVQLDRKKLLLALDAISVAARGCLDDTDKCKFEDIPLVEIHLPERLDGVVKACHVERAPACGVESYKVDQSAYCGFTHNVGTGPACGVLQYQRRKGAVCGFDASPVYGLYTWPNRMTSPQIKNSTCIAKGHDLSTGRIGCHGEPGGGPGTCNGANQPGNNEFIQCADYRVCSDISFGVEQYNSCANEAFGRKFNVCAHEQHGIAAYKSCSVADAEPHERCD